MELAGGSPIHHRWRQQLMEKDSESMTWLTRRDGSVVIGHGPFEQRPAPPESGVAFYVQNFALGDPAPWKIPHRLERTTAREFTSRFQSAPPMICEWSAPEAAPFSEVFQEVMQAIQQGLFEKTVPVVTETGLSRENPGDAIPGAMTRQPSPLYSYGWVEPGGGFAGATPELLFSLVGRRLETMALAGTARMEDRDAFAVDEKEIREHEYVAQTLISKLLDLGPLDRRPREILDLGMIVHFLTLIGVDLQALPAPDELIKRLHPTPALGPLPRTERTLGLLFDWRQRLNCPARFGAPFGLWDDGRLDVVVAIRGIWWEGRKLLLPAGCGIIEASRLVNEWRELRLKRETVKRFLLPSQTR